MSTLTGDLEAGYQYYADALTASNATSWVQRLALPAIQAAATLGLLKYQEGKREENNEKRLKLTDAAVKEWCACVENQILKVEDATDEVPEPAMYQPVHPAGEQLETLADNYEALQFTKEYAETFNEYRLEHDIARMVMMNPQHVEMTEKSWVQISDLVCGNISVSKVLRVTTDDAEAAVINGRVGATCDITRIHLGVETENAQAAGRAEQRVGNQSMESISPISGQFKLDTWALDPTYRIGVALQQGQLLQNAAQNAYNACARKPPHLLAEINMQLQKCVSQLNANASKAALLDGTVANYAGIFNSQIRDFSSALAGGIGSAFGGTSNGSGSIQGPFAGVYDPT